MPRSKRRGSKPRTTLTAYAQQREAENRRKDAALEPSPEEKLEQRKRAADDHERQRLMARIEPERYLRMFPHGQHRATAQRELERKSEPTSRKEKR